MNMSTPASSVTGSLNVTQLTRHFAAEVNGVDLREQLSEAAFQKILAAWHQFGVLRFRNQQIDGRHLKSFSARFGRLEIHIHKEFLDPEHPEVLLLSNRKRPDGSPIGMAETGRRWHSDLQYAAVPCIASVLFGQQTPTIGGDTVFASATAAYDALSEAMKHRLDGLVAIQSYAKTTSDGVKEAREKIVPDVQHPAVLVHSATGRKALYVSESMTRGFVGMPQDEAEDLLAELVSHLTHPEFVWAQQWKSNDLIIWDNRAVIHRATPYDLTQTRHMLRTTVMPAFSGV
jgi:taurine dioxygenase